MAEKRKVNQEREELMFAHKLRWLPIVAACLWVGPYAVAEDFRVKALKNLSCVKIVSDLDGEDISKLSIEAFSDRVLVALKAKVPRLVVSDDCRAMLAVSVTALNLTPQSGGSPTGFAIYTALEISRPVMVLSGDEEGGEPVILTDVWRQGNLQIGPPRGAPAAVGETIDDLCGKFAALYYKAGNP